MQKLLSRGPPRVEEGAGDQPDSEDTIHHNPSTSRTSEPAAGFIHRPIPSSSLLHHTSPCTSQLPVRPVVHGLYALRGPPLPPHLSQNGEVHLVGGQGEHDEVSIREGGQPGGQADMCAGAQEDRRAGKTVRRGGERRIKREKRQEDGARRIPRSARPTPH